MEVPTTQSSTSRPSMIVGSPRYPSSLSINSQQPLATPPSPIVLPQSSQIVEIPPELVPIRRETPVPSRQNSLNGSGAFSSVINASPDSLRSRNQIPTILPILPGASAMSEALSPNSSAKSGLIRRLSRGAANRLSRR